MSEVFDKYKSHKNLDDNESSHPSSDRVGRTWSYPLFIHTMLHASSIRELSEDNPYNYHGMCNNQSHQELENYHHDELVWRRHFLWHREVLYPDFPDWSDRVVPEPSEDEEDECPTGEESRVSKRREHEGEEIHRE